MPWVAAEVGFRFSGAIPLSNAINENLKCEVRSIKCGRLRLRGKIVQCLLPARLRSGQMKGIQPAPASQSRSRKLGSIYISAARMRR